MTDDTPVHFELHFKEEVILKRGNRAGCENAKSLPNLYSAGTTDDSLVHVDLMINEKVQLK